MKLTKEQRKDKAWEEYRKVEEPARKEYRKIRDKAWKECLRKCEEIDKEVEE